MESQNSPADAAPAHPPLEALAVQPLPNRDYESRPAVFYERLREEYGPVAPVDVLGVPAWLVIGYPQTLDIMRDTRGIWSKRLDSWRARREGRVPDDWPLLPAFETGGSLFRDGADLTRLRGAWSEGLRPFQDRARTQAKELERAIRRYADELINVLAENGGRSGRADLSAQYARPLPLMIVNRLLGAESTRGDEIIMDVWRMLDAGPDAAEAARRVSAEVAAVCADKAASPGEDLPSYMGSRPGTRSCCRPPPRIWTPRSPIPRPPTRSSAPARIWRGARGRTRASAATSPRPSPRSRWSGCSSGSPRCGSRCPPTSFRGGRPP